MRDKRNLITSTICHTLVDYVCISTLFYKMSYSETEIIFTITILYNIIAFGTQALIGYYIDIKKNKWVGLIGAISVGVVGLISCVSNLNSILIMTILGLGNAMFHIGTSLFVMNESKGKLSDLGIFVSSGAIGVGLGNISYSIIGSIALLIISGLWALDINKLEIKERTEYEFGVARNDRSWDIVILITFICIVVRSLGGGKPLYSIPGNLGIMLIYISSCIGKALGGILSDRYGARNIGIGTMLLSCISFGLSFMIGSSCVIIGVMAFNMAMPITLGVIVDKLKNHKCFGFGLTTLGLLIGYLLTLLQDKHNMNINKLEMIWLSLIAMIFIGYTTKNRGKSNV